MYIFTTFVTVYIDPHLHVAKENWWHIAKHDKIILCFSWGSARPKGYLAAASKYAWSKPFFGLICDSKLSATSISCSILLDKSLDSSPKTKHNWDWTSCEVVRKVGFSPGFGGSRFSIWMASRGMLWLSTFAKSATFSSGTLTFTTCGQKR